MKYFQILMILPALWSCQSDDIPLGFYDYQVERLLAGDSARTWFRTQYIVDGDIKSISTCEDSVFASFVLYERYSIVDSLYAFEIIPQSGCTNSDTILLGSFSASSSDNIFTDSLNFGDGPVDFMIVDNITSRFLKLFYQREGKNISASFEAAQ